MDQQRNDIDLEPWVVLPHGKNMGEILALTRVVQEHGYRRVLLRETQPQLSVIVRALKPISKQRGFQLDILGSGSEGALRVGPVCIGAGVPHLELRREDLQLRSPTGLHALPCLDCKIKKTCPGIDQSSQDKAKDAWAVSNLTPFPDAQSNSCNFILESQSVSLSLCREYLSQLGAPPQRVVFLKDKDQLTAAITDTGDFDDDALKHMQQTIGQVYIDTSEKALLDDFARDVRKLEPAGRCTECPGPDVCPGWMTVSDEDVFSRDETAEVLPILSQLHGDILDIGCGSLRYRDHVARHLNDSEGSYTAVEPFPPPGLRSFLGNVGGTLIEAGWEEADTDGRRYDWILVMRSWNHFIDLGESLHRIKRALKPDGKLLITENVPFGLVRTHGQLAHLTRTDLLPFEHYRNHESNVARRWLEATGFLIEKEVPVSRETSNQWLVLATPGCP